MSNYNTKIKCPHCGKEFYTCVLDLSHSLNNAVFTYCPECHKYIISEDMLKFCRVQTKFVEFVGENIHPELIDNNVLDRIIKILDYELSPQIDILLTHNIKSDLGADSLDEVTLVMSIEEEFGIEIEDSKAEKVKTVQDIYRLVCSLYL